MRPSARPIRPLATTALLAATVLIAGACGTEIDAARSALDSVPVPAWFPRPSDHAAGPVLTRTYRPVSRADEEVELRYAQSLDSAGWRFRAHDRRCEQVRKTLREADTCWTSRDLTLTYRARGGAVRADGSVGAGVLTVVVRVPG